MVQSQILSYMELAERADDREQCPVLLIDDDEAFLSELSETLDSLDYRTVVAACARDGLRKMADNPEIGIVLCDMRLPDIEGTELIAEMMARFAPSRPLVLILMSGYADYELALNALRLGVDDFVAKPLRINEIARCMRRARKTWSLRKEALRHHLANLSDPLDRSLLAPVWDPKPLHEPLVLAVDQDQPTPATGSGVSAIVDGLLLINRERDRLLDQGMFGDPAWDIVLELMRAKLRGEALPVSSACTASNAPLTTSLRWIRNMHKSGMLRRWNDPRDKRRDLIELSDEFFAKMVELFESVRQKRGNGNGSGNLASG